jgi:hypothetical protein
LARKGAVSYCLEIDSFTGKLEKACPENDIVYIYPSSEIDPLFSSYKDISAAPLAAGVETIQKIGREVGNILTGPANKKRRRK